ncbi:MAG: NRDE family protein [Roseibacillus sp.]
MCTLTWRGQDSLEVFFNRDELKTRRRAEPPSARKTENGTRYLAPTDPEAGGTWILANEHGLVACLLNRWHEESGQFFSKSRGLVVTELADCKSFASIRENFSAKCSGAKPFDLVFFQKGKVAAFSWSGKTLNTFQPQIPVTSSSFCFEKVRAARQKAFQESNNLENFQNPQQTPLSAFTVRMNRPDAQTWSRSYLKVTDTEIAWNYWEEFPNLSHEPKLHHSTLHLA